MPVRTLGPEGDGFGGGPNQLEKKTSATLSLEVVDWDLEGVPH